MAERSSRTAFLIDELGAGGAQRSALLTATAMHAQTSRVVLLAAKNGSYFSSFQGLPVYLLASRWPQCRAVAAFLWNLNRTVASEEIGVIITTGFGVARIALFARTLFLLRGVRLIVVEQNALSSAIANRFASKFLRSSALSLTRWLYRRAAAIVGVSEGVSRDLEETLRLPPGSVTTISNTVDNDRVTAATSESVPAHLEELFEKLPRPLVITTGRLVAQKAHHDLLNAFALLPNTSRGSLIILGEGPLRANLYRHAQQLGVEDRVWMPGFVDNPWWFIARSNVFALSSHWEGHPLVLLEALACGVPIASTDCPYGPREILNESSRSRLTPVGDFVALAQAIHDLLARPSRSDDDIDIGRYAPETAAKRYCELVARVASGAA